MKKIILLLIISLLLITFVSAENEYSISDTFTVGWTDGTDNYEAEYEVWKIEETSDGNKVSLRLMPTGIIGISDKKEGEEHNLGNDAKIIFEQIYISEEDKHIIIKLENAAFKEPATTTPSTRGSSGGSSSTTTSSTYQTYNINANELETGYTKDLSPGDRINFPMGKDTAYLTVSSVYSKSATTLIFAHDRQQFTIDNPFPSDFFTHEKKYEMTEDNKYDLKVTLNSAIIHEDGTRVASFTIQKISEKIPENTEINYECWKYYECRDGTRIKYCDYDANGRCGCRSVGSSECPQIEEVDSCTEWYTCPDNSKVKKCEISSDGR